MTQTSFEALELCAPILSALTDAGYVNPTPIQAAAIPELSSGRDLVGIAQTGTGKTAAFSLPLLQRLHANKDSRGYVRALILTPTRELAVQVDEAIREYGKHVQIKSVAIFGGVSIGNQIRSLRRRPEIVVATPGRLLDLVNQRLIRLDSVEYFVLDEADRMLDMGFIRDIRRIVGLLPKERQTALFSATMPTEVRQLANDLLQNPATVEAARPSTVSADIKQQLYFVKHEDKLSLLVDLLQNNPEFERVLIFTRTKHQANRLAKSLSSKRFDADAIHSNKSQGARQRALRAFAEGEVNVLVATDIVARGIDVSDISHVVNYDLPMDAESYVHRIGRTGRAGAQGTAVSFCSLEELSELRSIERLTKSPLERIEDHAYHSVSAATLSATGHSIGRSRGGQRSGSRFSGSRGRPSRGGSGGGGGGRNSRRGGRSQGRGWGGHSRGSQAS